jgi:hypothetical protein
MDASKETTMTVDSSEYTIAQSSMNADQQHRALWIIFLSGPVIYALYFLTVFVLGEFGCFSGLAQLTLMGFNPVRLGVIVLTVLAALLSAGIGLLGWRRWRAMRKRLDDTGHHPALPRDVDPELGPSDDDVSFMLFVGMWLNGLFTAVILLTAIPMLVGSACTWT